MTARPTSPAAAAMAAARRVDEIIREAGRAAEALEANQPEWERAASIATRKDRERWLAALTAAERSYADTIATMKALARGDAVGARVCAAPGCTHLILRGRSDRLYCSGTCRIRAHRDRLRARNASVTDDRGRSGPAAGHRDQTEPATLPAEVPPRAKQGAHAPEGGRSVAR